MAGTSLFEQLFPSGAPGPRQRLDELDLRLIDVLSGDGRASYAEIGERVGLSRATARRRVKRLFDDGIVAVHGQIDAALIGHEIATVCLVAAPITAGAVASALLDQSVFMIETAGRYDLMVQFDCANVLELGRRLDHLRSLEGVGEVETLTVLRHAKQNWVASPRARTGSGPVHVRPLDEIDSRLALALVDDGRASIARLAEVVGLSESATRGRVHSLIDSGVLSIEVVPGMRSVAIERFFAVFLDIAGPVDAAVRDAVAMSQTTVVVTTTGRHAVAVEAWAPDDARRDDVVDALRRLAGVTGAEVLAFRRGRRYFSDVAAS